MARERRSDQVARLVEALKFQFRSRGLRYADVASSLGLSHTTLKRRLAGSGLTIPFLESLCELLEISVAELFELANAKTDTKVRRLTLEQENALHADVRLGFIFSRVQLGWSAAEIQQECRIPEAPLIAHLIRLEKLGLIDLLPGNRIRLKTAREIEWRKHGPMWRSVDRYLKDIMSMTDSDDAELARRIAVVRLSQASIGQLDQLFHYVQAEVRRLAQADRQVPTDEKTWYAVLLGARPFEVDLSADSELPWWRRRSRPAAQDEKPGKRRIG
jgi:transcriptional regulator with XRE-family HTH domain